MIIKFLKLEAIYCVYKLEKEINTSCEREIS